MYPRFSPDGCTRQRGSHPRCRQLGRPPGIERGDGTTPVGRRGRSPDQPRANGGQSIQILYGNNDRQSEIRTRPDVWAHRADHRQNSAYQQRSASFGPLPAAADIAISTRHFTRQLPAHAIIRRFLGSVKAFGDFSLHCRVERRASRHSGRRYPCSLLDRPAARQFLPNAMDTGRHKPFPIAKSIGFHGSREKNRV